MVSIQSATNALTEGQSTIGAFVVRRTGSLSNDLRVELLATGTARCGKDYRATPTSVVIPSGQASVSIALNSINNAQEEGDRSVTLNVTTNNRPFTLALLPDTQYYVSFPIQDQFFAQTHWIADHRNEHNIVYVLHEGDCTDGNTVAEWNRVKQCMTVLNNVVPYALSAGNHDGLMSAFNVTANFNNTFPVSAFSSWPTFGGVFEVNRLDNNYHLFSAGGVDWLLVSYEFGPRNEVLAWIGQLIASYPNRRVILVSHAHVYSDDTLHGSSPFHYWTPTAYGRYNNGPDVWEKLIRRHANISFVFNGHVLNDGAGRVVGTNDAGGLVYQMLANYQILPNGGNAFLRLVEFHPVEDKFTVKSYSPSLDTFLQSEKQQFEYTGLGLFNSNLTYQIDGVSNAATVIIRDNDLDTNGPIIMKLLSVGVPPTIAVTFDEKLNRPSAENPQNFLLDNGVNVVGSTLGTDAKTVTLTTVPQLSTGVVYTLTVTNLRDASLLSNTIAPRFTAQFDFVPIYLVENFEGPQFQGWTVVDDGAREGPSQWNVRLGRLQQSANLFGPDVYAQDHRQGTYAYWNSPAAANWRDYIFAATVNSQDDDGVGLMFHFQNRSNYYKLELDAQRSFRKLFKMVNGQETTLASETVGYPVNTDFQLSVEYARGTITAKFNDTVMFGGSISDASLPTGSVALYCWGDQGVSFGSVVVAPDIQAIIQRPVTNAPAPVLPLILNLVPIDGMWLFWPFYQPPSSGWQNTDFDDSYWPGPNGAIFAYSPYYTPDPVNTSLGLGPVSFYFRARFNYTNSLQGTCLRIKHLVDDGAVFYLNGQEILRSRMPDGAITNDTLAAQTVTNAYYDGPFDIPSPNLRIGENVFAVEVHQADSLSEDVVFGAELEAVIPPPIAVSFDTYRLLSASELMLTLPGTLGRVYVVESSTDLRNWVTASTKTNEIGTALPFNFGLTNGAHGFYRAWQIPTSCSER